MMRLEREDQAKIFTVCSGTKTRTCSIGAKRKGHRLHSAKKEIRGYHWAMKQPPPQKCHSRGERKAQWKEIPSLIVIAREHKRDTRWQVPCSILGLHAHGRGKTFSRPHFLEYITILFACPGGKGRQRREIWIRPNSIGATTRNWVRGGLEKSGANQTAP